MAVNLHEKSATESLPMTPLIDVVFLLLIFFLVATTLSEEERQMNIQVPVASEARPLVAKPSELVVNVDASGQYYISGENVKLSELQQAFDRAWANNHDRTSVLIRADRQCPWDHVMAALNACNKAKIRDYRVTALPTK